MPVRGKVHRQYTAPVWLRTPLDNDGSRSIAKKHTGGSVFPVEHTGKGFCTEN